MTPAEIIKKNKEKKFLNDGDAAMRQFMDARVKEITAKTLADALPVIIADAAQQVQAEIVRLTKDVQKGEKGEMPVPGVDFPLPKDGKNYILTPADKKAIASTITVPVVEKIIERREIIKEQPLIKNEIKEIAKYESPEQIAKKLNTLSEAVDFGVIRGLKTWMTNVQRSMKEKHGGGKAGGGMGDWNHESIPVDSSTTSIRTSTKIAADGYALLAFYQGGMIARGAQYTVSDRQQINLLFTPEDNTTIDLAYVRT